MDERMEDIERRLTRIEERLDEMEGNLPNPRFPRDAAGGTYVLAPLRVVNADGRMVFQVMQDEDVGTLLYLLDPNRRPAIVASASAEGERSITVFNPDGSAREHLP